MSRAPKIAIAYPLLILASVALAVWSREVWFTVAAGVMWLLVQIVRARAWKTERGKIAVANVLTFVRLALVAALPTLLASLPRALFVALIIAILVLDGVDGWVARTRGESSAFGASLDMETDALMVLVLGLLLQREGAMGAWVLAAGLWRYVFAAAVAIVPALGDFPPSRIYRWIFCVLVVALAGAFVPWSGLARAFAAVGTVSVSFSFLHSIVRSRAFSKVRVNEAVRP